jgi:hypothetical protein
MKTIKTYVEWLFAICVIGAGVAAVVAGIISNGIAY